MQLQRKQEKAHRDERRELLSGSDAGAAQRKLQTEADIVGEAKGATDSLKRTRMLMAQVCYWGSLLLGGSCRLSVMLLNKAKQPTGSLWQTPFSTAVVQRCQAAKCTVPWQGCVASLLPPKYTSAHLFDGSLL